MVYQSSNTASMWFYPHPSYHFVVKEDQREPVTLEPQKATKVVAPPVSTGKPPEVVEGQQSKRLRGSLYAFVLGTGFI